MCLRGEKQERSDKHPTYTLVFQNFPCVLHFYATKIPDGILPLLNKEHNASGKTYSLSLLSSCPLLGLPNLPSLWH